jgi:hypothetical protein
MGTKPARFHPWRVIFTTDLDKPIEPAFSLVRRRGAGEARPHARTGIGARVNWLTSSRPPPVSRSDRFIFPASSANTR